MQRDGKKAEEPGWGGNVVNIASLRRQNAPYIIAWILYYTWVVAFATWWTASPAADTAFTVQLRGLMHLVNLISSAVFVFFIRKERFIITTRVGAAAIAAGMAVFFLAPDGEIRLAAAVISSVAVGCVNIGLLMPFVFTLNNTEKLCAVVVSNALIQLVSLLLELNAGSGRRFVLECVVSFGILGASLFTILFLRKPDAAGEKKEIQPPVPQGHRRIYLTVLFNCAIAVLCKGAGKGILDVAAAGSPMPLLIWYYAGGLVGCAVFILVYAFVGKAFVWLGNITFSTVAMGILCNAFTPRVPGSAVSFAVLLGIGSTVGMINMYYIIGVVGKKYDSMRYLRMSILFIGACGGISGVAVGSWIGTSGSFGISMTASVVSAAVMIFFMLTSPVIAGAEYENDWGKDSHHTDIGQEDPFRKYGLSKRETEVCGLLLQGYTMRQVSGILSIAYSTVNTYCTSAYRKLGINSRTELLLLFREYAAK